VKYQTYVADLRKSKKGLGFPAFAYPGLPTTLKLRRTSPAFGKPVLSLVEGLRRAGLVNPNNGHKHFTTFLNSKSIFFDRGLVTSNNGR